MRTHLHTSVPLLPRGVDRMLKLLPTANSKVIAEWKAGASASNIL